MSEYEIARDISTLTSVVQDNARRIDALTKVLVAKGLLEVEPADEQQS